MARSKIDQILMSLSDTEVELLIRKYVGKMQKRMVEGTPVQFQVNNAKYAERERRGYWTVGSPYGSSSVHTEGEVLADTVNEQNRRCGFKSDLLLLEAADTDTIDGECC